MVNKPKNKNHMFFAFFKNIKLLSPHVFIIFTFMKALKRNGISIKMALLLLLSIVATQNMRCSNPVSVNDEIPLELIQGDFPGHQTGLISPIFILADETLNENFKRHILFIIVPLTSIQNEQGQFIFTNFYVKGIHHSLTPVNAP